jgi:hypothetical protein
MSAKTKFSYVLAGVAGAISVHIVIQTLFWVLSFGFTFADYFMIRLFMLPMPIVFGTVAGVLVSLACRARCQAWAFVLAAIGMIGAMVRIAYSAGPPSSTDIISNLWGPTLSGVAVQLVILVIARVGVYLFRTVRY